MSIGRLTGDLPKAGGASNKDAVQLPDEVAAFCRRQCLEPYVQMASDLVKKCFSPQEIAFEMEVDPETGEDWLVVNITVQGNRQDVLAAYRSYSYEWVRSVPWPQRNLICVSYDIR